MAQIPSEKVCGPIGRGVVYSMALVAAAKTPVVRGNFTKMISMIAAIQ